MRTQVLQALHVTYWIILGICVGMLIGHRSSSKEISRLTTRIHALEAQQSVKEAVAAQDSFRKSGDDRPCVIRATDGDCVVEELSKAQKEELYLKQEMKSGHKCVQMTTWMYDGHPTTVITIPDGEKAKP